MFFVFVYLPQLVDAWLKFANSASKVVKLRHNMNKCIYLKTKSDS